MPVDPDIAEFLDTLNAGFPPVQRMTGAQARAAIRSRRTAIADPAGLPPTIIATAGFDPLRSEGRRFAQALTESGVRTVHRCYEGAIHGFITMPGPGTGCAGARPELGGLARTAVPQSEWRPLTCPISTKRSTSS